MENQTDSQYKARPVSSAYRRFYNAFFAFASEDSPKEDKQQEEVPADHDTVPPLQSPPFEPVQFIPLPKAPKTPKPKLVLPERLIINKSHLSRYLGKSSSYSYPEVLEIVWQAGELNSIILKQFPNVTKFDCYRQRLDDIEAVSCLKKLEYLKCSRNNLVGLGGLDGCTQLRKIKCNRNELVTLVGLGGPMLEAIKCKRNNLTSLEGLEGCDQLMHIECSHNRISTLGALRGCTARLTLVCDHNQLYTLDGLEGCPNLKSIACNHNSLTSIRGLGRCWVLGYVDCSNNKLSNLVGLENKTVLTMIRAGSNRLVSLKGLAGCGALTELRVQHNKIRSTKGLDDCRALTELHLEANHLSKLVLGPMPKLKIIDCDKNAIVSLEGLAGCPVLDILHCSSNCIVRLPDFSSSPLLRIFRCQDNVLTSLEGLEGSSSLERLECEQNCLVDLKGLEGCRSLTRLDCNHNRITTIEHVIRLRNLRSFAYTRNPIGHASIQVEHFLHMIGERKGESSTIYSDGENVSDPAVKESVFNSIQNLLKDPAPTFSLDDLKGNGLTDRAISWLTNACNDSSRNSNYLITYKQLLSYVWQRICTSVHKEELIRVLEQQVTESIGRCNIGRLTRLLAVLVGFYDDIHIAISSGAQICAAIKVAKDKLESYNAQTHRNLVETHLKDLGYTDDEAKPWLDAIYDLEEAS